ncbi:uncharacterized protein [Dermacentor albipictus]|uniref:uncharacterized protein n=1 Tax=Dermacentor albipictus TaxID=60249 RepID=UPI0038FC78F9
MTMNDVFDALNTKHPAEGIRKGSPKIEIIKEFLDLFNITEHNCHHRNTLMFASRQTTEALRVTLMSLDIIDELHEAGVPYLPTVKLNQDPLEKIFGVVRSFHGDDDHPSVVQFSQIYRLLSLFTPVKNAVRGNCSGAPDGVLVSLHDSLGQKAKAAAKLKGAVEAKLYKKLCGMSLSVGHMDDLGHHRYQKVGTQEMVVYYLAVYTVKKVTKSVSCKRCVESLESASVPPSACDPRPSHSLLTELRSFKPWCLREPSFRMFTVIKHIEEIIRHTLDSNAVFGDLFWSILDGLDKASVPALGCDNH